MNAMTSLLTRLLISFLALAVPISLAAQDHANKPRHHHYKLIDLGAFGGPTSFTQDELQVLNHRGMVAGSADTSVPNHPNSCTIFCGGAFIAHAFLWSKGVLHELRSLPGSNTSNANWISDSGLVAGFSETEAIDPLLGVREEHAVLWKDGEIIDLGTLEGGHKSVAFTVNSRGQVAGAAFNTVPDPFTGGTQMRTFLWENGVMRDLGTLGGPDAGIVGSFKGNVEMNERGQVVACSFTNSTINPVTGTPTVDPFLWDKEQGMIDLGTLGGTSGCAIYLNNRGQVVGYSNVGTVEFLLAPDSQFYFIEMNTRIQVEHGVTEMVTAIDLVKESIRLASGELLGPRHRQVEIDGAAIECRVYAEDPNTHLPSPGVVANHHPPGGLGIRVETALYDGYRVPVHYDPLIAKVIAHAEDRALAIRRAQAALREYLVDGIKTNIPLHLRILEDPDFTAGQFGTDFLSRFEPRLELIASRRAKAS